MKIAWISKIGWDMPHKTSRLKMSNALRKRNNDIKLYMVKNFREKIDTLDYINCIPTIKIPILSGLFYGLIVFFYFPILFKKQNFDVILIDGTKVWLPFIIPLKMLRKKIILDIRTLPIDKNKLLSFNIIMFLSRYIVNGITTITPELKKTIQKNYNLEKMKIGLWSSGVSLEDFDIASKIENNYFTKKNRLLYHGDYSPTRGIENLISSISKLDRTIRNNLELIIIGIPENKINKLKILCEKEGVEKEIKILPKVSYEIISKYIKESDIGVIPLPPENKWWRVSAPLKTLEYLASSKPIIATNIPFHERIFKKGNCGKLIKSGSPEAIADAINEIFKNKEKLKEMGLKGRKIVEKYYTWAIMAEKFEIFLKTI